VLAAVTLMWLASAAVLALAIWPALPAQISSEWQLIVFRSREREREAAFQQALERDPPLGNKMSLPTTDVSGKSIGLQKLTQVLFTGTLTKENLQPIARTISSKVAAFPKAIVEASGRDGAAMELARLLPAKCQVVLDQERLATQWNAFYPGRSYFVDSDGVLLSLDKTRNRSGSCGGCSL
jgi:hypothetical protein